MTLLLVFISDTVILNQLRRFDVDGGVEVGLGQEDGWRLVGNKSEVIKAYELIDGQHWAFVYKDEGIQVYIHRDAPPSQAEWNELQPALVAADIIDVRLHQGGVGQEDDSNRVESTFPDEYRSIMKIYRFNREGTDEFFIRFIRALWKSANGSAKTGNWFRQALGPSSNLLSVHIHHLSHLFDPIDIDLQGLAEVQYRNSYWKEVCQVYTGKDASGILGEARKILFGTENSVEDALMGLDLSVNPHWQKLLGHIPVQYSPNSNGHTRNSDYSRVLVILNGIGKPGSREAVRRADDGAVFHRWYMEIREALYRMRDELLPETDPG